MKDIIIEIIKAVPYGKVCTYSEIARLAGLSNGARRVARILHACTAKYDLPWHRIVRYNGEIALGEDSGGAEQKELLMSEGVIFSSPNRVSLGACLWIMDGEGELED